LKSNRDLGHNHWCPVVIGGGREWQTKF